MLNTYAIVRRPPPDLMTGQQGEPLRFVPCGQVYAAVGEVCEARRIDESSLRGHEQTVRALAARVDSILPARFGSVAPDEEALAKLLQSREEELLRALALVAGREQMTLRVYGEVPPTGFGPPDDPSLGPGARYLATKQRQGNDELMAAMAPVRQSLQSLVRAERMERRDTPPLLANCYHLIERGESARYSAALTSGAENLPSLRFVASGPWPPYAFGPADLVGGRAS